MKCNECLQPVTSFRRAAATICPAPLLPPPSRSASRGWADGNVAAVSHGQHVPTPTAEAAWRANTAVSKAAWWPWLFDLESGVRVTCDVGYLCANFDLPRPLCPRLRPDVRDRQTAVRQHHRLMPRLLGAGHNKRGILAHCNKMSYSSDNCTTSKQCRLKSQQQ